MRYIYTLLLILIGFHQNSTAQTFVNRAVDGEYSSEFIDGYEWIFRSNNGITVGVCNNFVKTDYGKYYQLGIHVINNSDHTILFNPEDVDALLLTNKDHDKTLNVYTNDDFQKKIKKKQNLSLGLYAFSVGLNGSRPSDYMNLESMKKSYDYDRENLSQTYLKKNTMHPGQSIYGYMNVQHGKGKLLTIRICLDNTYYVYAWDIDKNKKAIKPSDDDPIY